MTEGKPGSPRFLLNSGLSSSDDLVPSYHWSAGCPQWLSSCSTGCKPPRNPQWGYSSSSLNGPIPQSFPYFYAKPITWFAYFSFVYWPQPRIKQRKHFSSSPRGLETLLFLVRRSLPSPRLRDFYNFMVCWLSSLNDYCRLSPATLTRVARHFRSTESSQSSFRDKDRDHSLRLVYVLAVVPSPRGRGDGKAKSEQRRCRYGREGPNGQPIRKPIEMEPALLQHR